MISFRFHVVSLTAVFLAIAIGVVVGTTYVDRAVVEGLENRVDNVSNNLDQRKAENDALERDLDDVRRYAEGSADFAVTGRLTGTPVLLLAVRGVSEEVATQTLALARRAGAQVPGITWIESRWALDGGDDKADLAAAARLDASLAGPAVVDGALSMLVSALGARGEGADATVADAVLAGLVSEGFLSVDPQGDGPASLAAMSGRAPRILLLTSSDLPSGLSSVIGPLLARSSGSGLPTVAAESYVSRADGPKRGQALLAGIDDDVRDRVGIVDDADVPEGRVAAILALDEVAAGRASHFGYGPGSESPLPAWSAP